MINRIILTACLAITSLWAASYETGVLIFNNCSLKPVQLLLDGINISELPAKSSITDPQHTFRTSSHNGQYGSISIFAEGTRIFHQEKTTFDAEITVYGSLQIGFFPLMKAADHVFPDWLIDSTSFDVNNTLDAHVKKFIDAHDKKEELPGSCLCGVLQGTLMKQPEEAKFWFHRNDAYKVAEAYKARHPKVKTELTTDEIATAEADLIKKGVKIYPHEFTPSNS